MPAAKHSKDDPTVIKKYANRRLYDTGRSSYVTLDDLCDMVKEGHDFVVYDAKSGDDLTRQVLTQIIVDQESKDGQNLLPIGFLRQLIGFYGDNVGTLVPNYLEQSIESFAKHQEQLREQINKSIGGMFPFGNIEELNKQNLAMFQKAMTTFSPFSGMQNANGFDTETQSDEKQEKMDALKQNIAAMQEELDNMSK